MRILQILIIFGVLALYTPVSVEAFGQFDPEKDNLASHWADLPIPVVVDGGTLFGEDNGLSLVQQAVEVWNTVPGVPVLLSVPQNTAAEDFNLSNQLTWDISDYKIRVVFDEDGEILLYGGIDPTSGTLGIGLTLPGVSGSAVEGIMIINGHSSAAGYPDRVGIIVHEFGHILGLTHTPVGFGGLEPVSESNRPTMYPFTGSHAPSSLETDDISGIRSIYGQ